MSSEPVSVRAVVFDLDDTLYLERDYAISGFRAVAKNFCLRLQNGDERSLEARMIDLFDTRHRPRVFDRLLEEIGIPAESGLAQEMIRTYREHYPAIQLPPDSDRALGRLREQAKLGIITDGFSNSQWNKIDALGLRERLDAIIVTSDLRDADCVGRDYAAAYSTYEKPCPLAFDLISERLGVEPRDCTYVADNALKDFFAPRKLGWQTIQIQRVRGVHTAKPASEVWAPHHIIETLDFLDGLIAPA